MRLASEKRALADGENDLQWKIINEEEANRAIEREKKKQRNIRKMQIKQEGVVQKMFKNEYQVQERKTHQE